MKTRKMVLLALLSAIALTIFMIEAQIPMPIPIPGIKLGLANIVTVFALYVLGPGQAMLILIGRCLLGAVFAGNMNALIFSLLGGVSAMLVMISTVICLLMGYPIAYIMARAKERTQKTMVTLIMIPMWMNFLIRTYAWMTILQDTGIMNGFLSALGIGTVHIIGTKDYHK